MNLPTISVAAKIRFAGSATALTLTLALAVQARSAVDRPNLLIVMVDDLGFSDIGSYGGEIDTPNLDQLAADGIRFSQFYTAAKCQASRISLLTGRYAIQAGNTSLRRAVTSAEVLGNAGYFTAMTGKWHLDGQPTDFGFERYFGHLSGATNYFRGNDTFRLNGRPWIVPSENFYTTVANVDFALRFLNDARETGRHWYLYVAFNAPHAPLQPMEVDYKKYQDRYDVGWDVIREARWNKQKRLGLFADSDKPSPRPDHVPAWRSLSEKRKSWESRRMAAYAGMIDRVDQELGRLIEDLRQHGEIDNTLILFLSDNGASPFDRRSSHIERPPFEPQTTWSDSTGWAWARNTPFRFYKQNQFEGGIATPAIVHWPSGLKREPGSIVEETAHLIDVLPTLAELAGAELPERWPGRRLEPVSGISLAALLAGKPLGPRPPIHFLYGADRGLRDGDWKLVSFRGEPWELYNLAKDRTELDDVAARYPETLDRLVKRWDTLNENVLHAPPNTRRPLSRTDRPTVHIHREWTQFDTDPGEARKAGEHPNR